MSNIVLKFPFDPELSRNSGLSNEFPDHSIPKMEIFFGKNGNPSNPSVLCLVRTLGTIDPSLIETSVYEILFKLRRIIVDIKSQSQSFFYF